MPYEVLDVKKIYRILFSENQKLNFVIDSRNIKPGDIFVAIQAARDGHDFIVDALDKGAKMVIASKAQGILDARILYVRDTVEILGQLASLHCDFINFHSIAITGSNGKSTVKDLLAQILIDCVGFDAVLATFGNWNNHLGVPLSILSATKTNTHAVLEFGMSAPGEILALSNLVKPKIVVITNILRAHLENHFSLEKIAESKAEIFSHAKIAWLNSSDKFFPFLKKLAAQKSVEIKSFGLDKNAICRAENIQITTEKTSFFVRYGNMRQKFETNLLGKHNVMNILAAVSLALSVSCDLEKIAASVRNFQARTQRLQVINFGQKRIIDDSYNANPDSVKAALRVLKIQKKPRIFIMGDLAQLGSDFAKMYAEIGLYARGKCERAYFIGSDSFLAFEAYGQGAYHFRDVDEFCSYLPKMMDFSCALVKASRFMAFEKIIDALVRVVDVK